jgi:hypothetical protein
MSEQEVNKATIDENVCSRILVMGLVYQDDAPAVVVVATRRAIQEDHP